MAQKIVTIYTDDLTGEEAHEVAIDPFIKAARKTGRGKGQAAKRSAKAAGENNARIRAWRRKTATRSTTAAECLPDSTSVSATRGVSWMTLRTCQARLKKTRT